MRDLLFLTGFIAMILPALRQPHIGVMLWAWTGLIVHNAYSYGFATRIPFNKIVAITTIIIVLFSSEPKRMPRGSAAMVGLLILFGAWGTVSYLTAISDGPQVADYYERLIKALVFALMVLLVMRTRHRIESLLYAIYFSLGFHGVVAGAKFIASGGTHHVYGPGSSIIGDNNHFALTMVMVLPLVLYLYQQASHKLVRWALLGSGLIVGVSIMGTFSRGGLIGIAAIGALAFARSRRKLRFAAVVLPIVAMAVAFAPERWSDRMDTIKEAGDDHSFMGRVIAWKQSTLIALDHPVFGGGFHAVQDMKIWTEGRAKFGRLDFIPTDMPDPDTAFAAHSIYFEVLGDMGFGGLALFLLMLIGAWRNATAVERLARGREDLKWLADLALYLKYALAAYVVSGAALSMAYFDFSYMVIALVVALRGIAEQEATQPAKVPAAALQSRPAPYPLR